MKLRKNVTGSESKKHVLQLLKSGYKDQDVIVLAGAGDVYTYKDDIIRALEK